MEINDTELKLLVLSGLWHDVGKICQKAEIPLRTDYSNLRTFCCPSFHTGHTHLHVLYGGQFVGENFQDLKEAGKEIENLILYHHKPENIPSPEKKRTCKILTLADWLSSGERSPRPEDEEKGSTFREPLISIFSKLNPESHPEYFPLQPLGTDFIIPASKPEEALKPNSYFQIYQGLENDAKTLKKDSIDDFIIQSYYLLMKYGFFVPSAAWKSKPDVSLFGHSQTTAAIAACLFLEGIQEAELDRIKNALIQGADPEGEVLGAEKFLLIGGDISGIQDFIYSITSEGALKSLRGRSFYLQMLTEALAKTILRELGLSLANLLTCAGGHFYILAPIQGTTEKLERVKKDFNSVLIKAHRGKLTAVIASCPISWGDFLQREKEQGKEEKISESRGFVETWGRVGLLLGMEKRRKFKEFLSSQRDQIFGPFDDGGLKKVCPLCGEELDEGEKCPLCLSFEELSRDLSKTYLIEKTTQPNFEGRPQTWQEVLEALGWEYRFSNSPQKGCYAINSTDFTPFNGLGFKFIGKHAPTMDGQIITLDSMAEKATGLKRWGVLRGDVDHLGKIIREGLKDDKTISRLNTFSSLLSFFFSSQVEKIIQEEFSDSCYLVYAGGDDLLAIGAWDKLPELALKVREQFQQFTSSNCTISCGLSVPPSVKFPFYQAVRDAGDMENKSKSEGRNRITFLDETITWEEFKEIAEIKEEILQLISNSEDEKPVRSLLRILQIGYEEKNQLEKGRIPLERIWRLVYSLKRFAERCIKEEKQDDFLMQIRNRFICNYSIKPHLNVAVRWAEFLTRKER